MTQPTPGPIEVSILVVSYNTKAMTLACLDSIARETSVRHEVIVVDNASRDGSAEAVAVHPSRPRLIARTDNLGFAGANNVAALEARGEFVLLLNPDTIVLDRAIDRLVAFARRRPHAGIWGGRTVFGDGGANPASCWGRMTPWNLFCRAVGLTGLLARTEIFNGEAYGGWKRDSERAVDIVSGCFLLMPRQLWESLRGFDPQFFMYGEEADLCLRARRFGARPAMTPEAVIVHYGGASETARVGKMVRLLSAKALLIRRHWHPLLCPLGQWLLTLWPGSRALATGVRAAVTGRADHHAGAQAWREIWAARATWRRGYQGTLGQSHADAAPTSAPVSA